MEEHGNDVVWPGWETVRVIGRGSYGTVYEIQKQGIDGVEKAALKVVSIPGNPSDIQNLYNEGYAFCEIAKYYEECLRRIHNEYSLMRKMNDCAHIVHCDESRYLRHRDQIGWDFFIKMELLIPLVDTLPKEIPEDTVIKLGMDMCSALEACERLNIVHRDIKPQNIFMSGSGCYKLGDFGVAKVIEQTMSGTRIGTYQYMAPEVYHGQPYGASADLYSLGLVLYWLLNGRRMPFSPSDGSQSVSGTGEEPLCRRLPNGQLPAPAHGGAELKRIVQKACAYRPEDRYLSAAQMWADLRSYAARGRDETVLLNKRAGEGELPSSRSERAEYPGLRNDSTHSMAHAQTGASKGRNLLAIGAVAGVLGLTLAVGGLYFAQGGEKSETGPAAAVTQTAQGAEGAEEVVETQMPVPSLTPEPAPTSTPAAPAPTSHVRQFITDAGMSVNLREQPQHKSGLVGKVPDHTLVSFSGEVGKGYGSDGLMHDWYKVEANGLTGWVRSDLLCEVVETTDLWKEDYRRFIDAQRQKHEEIYGTLSETYKLVNIDGDGIPELYISWGTVAEGDLICTYGNGAVVSQPLSSLGLTYLEGQNLFMDAGGRMDAYHNTIYSIENGAFVKEHEGEYGLPDNSTPALDSGGTPNYEYRWDGKLCASQTEYQEALEGVYHTDRATDPFEGAEYDTNASRYMGNGLCSYQEILAAITAY